ncbi:MAG: hypothetical protein LBG46_06880 [Elusimicrobiota bacterium]|jgi:hypothetical protein|nr:hypothetical protein [Elusimicrobiota bacterium]
MSLRNNLHYFKISIANPEKLEKRYMFLEWDKNIDKYVSATKKLKELLATVKTLKEKNLNADEIYKDIYELMQMQFVSKSELNCFVNACDSTMATIQNDFSSFKKIVDLYLKYRDFTELTPKEWIQAIIDKGASRAKGSIGEDKLIEIANRTGFVFVDNWNDFSNIKKCIVKFSKNIFDIQNIRKNLGVDLKFSSQNKMLDIIVKNGRFLTFIEAKHLKEGGGEQNKAIEELINVIKKPKNGKQNIFYGAFIDGVYANVLLDLEANNIDNPKSVGKYGKNKTITHKLEIIKALKANPNSLWFNTSGYTAFIKDFSEI